jgi:SAM-dependent methyltransferase
MTFRQGDGAGAVVRDPECDYLCVDAFMADAVGARALASAFETRLIDDLLQHQPCAAADVSARLRLEPRGLALLLSMLRANGVVDEAGGAFRLSNAFALALAYRDLIEAKLQFCRLVAPDFFELFTVLLTAPEAFFERARLFKLFSYERCFDPTPENLEMTSRWVGITTALTRHESPVLLRHHDFSPFRHMLDIGGNSGELALQVCRRNPDIEATVCDLPLVCDIGAAHVGAEPEAGRIAFLKSGPEAGALPGGFDLVTFKSMLHDWPDAHADVFLERARAALEPGGRLLIFERGAFDPAGLGASQLPYSLIPVVLFFRSYRTPDEYTRRLERLGFRDIRVETIMLEMPFILVTAVK